jgi:hypothetical protein
VKSLDVDLEQWEPWSPTEVAERLRDIPAPWYVLGGWALDLFLGRQTREHEDAEIGVPLDRFPEFAAALTDLELVVVGDGRAWPLSEASLAAYRQTWVREPGGLWRLDVIRERWEGREWVFRRDTRIRLRGDRAIMRTSQGIPFLRPEVVLLFKAKAVRPKDEHDFRVSVPALDREARDWLTGALRLAHPGHAWLVELASR